MPTPKDVTDCSRILVEDSARWSRTRVLPRPGAHPTDRRQRAGRHVRLDAAEINTWLRDAEDKDQADAEQSLVKATRAGCQVPAGSQRRLSQDSLLLCPAHHFVGSWG